MKQTFISFRVVITFCALLLLAQACRRDDPYHPSKPRCMIETHLVQKDNEQSGANLPWEVVVMQLLGHLNTTQPHHIVILKFPQPGSIRGRKVVPPSGP